MLTIKTEKHILKNLKKYLRKDGRVSFELHELTELIRFSPLINYSKHIQDIQSSVHTVFKFYLLFHRLIIQTPTQNQTILQLLSKLRCSPRQNPQEMLQIKLIKPYRLYLQRRIQLSLQQEREEGGAERQVKVYQLLNLINLATSFCDVIYTFGRYYLGKYGCAIDFNILLGVDLTRLYEQMVQSVRRPANRAILEEIEAAHQKMYVVFYNCYFHKYLKSYIPKWVNTDVNTSETKKKQMTPHKESTKSTLNRDVSGKQRSLSVFNAKKVVKNRMRQHSLMGDSCLFLNQKVQQQTQQDPEYEENYGSFYVQSRVSSLKKSVCEVQADQLDEFQKERLKLLLSMERVIARN